MTTAERKAAIRSEIRSLRRILDEHSILAASCEVAQRAVSLRAFQDAELILSYKPAKNELDPAPIDRAALEAGKRVAYPLCIEDGGLRLYVPNTENSFVVGAYGILEPDPADSVEVPVSDIDFIITPGIAFDEDCMRLGQGGGYYDRLLDQSSAFTAGVGYDFQCRSDVPTEPHDRPLSCVLTPSFEFFRSAAK